MHKASCTINSLPSGIQALLDLLYADPSTSRMQSELVELMVAGFISLCGHDAVHFRSLYVANELQCNNPLMGDSSSELWEQHAMKLSHNNPEED